MRIVTAPNPILRSKAAPVELHELPKMRSLAQQMTKLMYKCEGCGLAAPQVGLSKRLIVVDTDQHEDERGRLVKNPHCYVNPVITQAWGEEEQSDEGCLSVPGISIPIKRPSNVVMEALDLDGQPLTVQAQGFAARALQHEVDHLEGVTMFEHLDPITRIQYLKEYEAAVAAGAKPGDTGRNKD